MTLAYLFWHWPRPGVAAAEYERSQRGFHAALAGAPPAGFARSLSLAIAETPWTASGSDAYEDWYLVDGFGALGALNDAAVTASRRRSHDAAAALAQGGAGGVYRLRLGEALPDPRWAFWLDKPAGMAYDEFWRLLEPAVAGGAAVWMRQMVLGPAREICLQAEREMEVAAELTPLRLRLRRVWP
jgi:hypothetical protein